MANNDIAFSSLDPSQRRALEQITNDTTSNLHIVYGPPGTGKSQLVVSLLERLAANHQKVLFVSQNTEALRVIERMIRKTEKIIGYPTDNSYVSLLDMCLMLYEPAQRKLKYLREHFTAVSAKNVKTAKEIKEPAPVAYDLSYTHLNHDDNYNIKTGEIGFDELMAYYLKYVTFELAPEVLSEFEKVDVRRVFQLIDDYEYQEQFGDFAHPRRELCLLTTNNPELNLPMVREQVKKLRSVLNLPDSASTAADQAHINTTGSPDSAQVLPAKVTLNVVDYVDTLLLYGDLAQDLNIYAVSISPDGMGGLIQELQELTEEASAHQKALAHTTAELQSVQKHTKYPVNGLSLDTPPMELAPVFVTSAEQNLSQVLADLEMISTLTKEITTFASGLKYSSPQELQINLAKAVAEEYQQVFDFIQENQAENLLAQNTAQIQSLHNDLHAYFAITGPKKLLRRVPESFVALDLKNHQWMEAYRDTLLPAFDQLATTLSGTEQGIQWILDLARQKSAHSLAKLGVNYQSADELLYFFATSSKLYLLLERYGLASLSYDELIKRTQQVYTALKTLQELWLDEANGRLIFQHGLKAFLNVVEQNRQILRLEADLQQAETKYQEHVAEHYNNISRLLKRVSSPADLAGQAANILEKIRPLEQEFLNLASRLELPITDCTLDLTYLRRVRQILLEVNQFGCFSDFAFEMEPGKTLATWLSKILCLEQYSNDAEIATFVEHNNFIEALHLALGEANCSFIDEILAQENLDYEKFTARLVNALVREAYGRSPISARKRIEGDQAFFAEYATYLKNQKVRVYSNDLQEIYLRSAPAMHELAREATLRDATKSTFEKFRANTAKILEAFPIVCATPKEVAKYLAPCPEEFDYVIFDEASQLLPGQALPAIFRAKKAVVIGDPHQMPPTLNLGFGMVESDDEDEEEIGESILDLVRKQPQRQHHLKVHYRSRYNKLFEPSRRAIYAEEGIEPIFEAEPSRRAPIAIEDNLGEDNIANFHRICASARDYLASDNAWQDEPGAVFCILFARAEVMAEFKRFLAEDEINEKYRDIIQLYNQDKILLSTVTNCQGIEGLYTIIYLQYYSAPAAMWFFKEGAGAYKRLNVSITRQREGLKLLLANPRSAWTMACDSKINNPHTGPNTRLSAELMKYLLESAGEETDFLYLERTLGDNINHFDSPLTEQLYHKLEEHYGYKIGKTLKIYSEVGWNLLVPNGEGINQNDRNVGFRIDLGVYSITQQKFVLGIEMDGAAYHTGYLKEQSDYNRQQVLEAKGWNLYRIWSTNWLNDEAHEFERLVARIDELLEE